MPNIFDPDWDSERDADPYVWRRARLARQAGAQQLGASLFELPPGAATFPMHVHYANEEMVVVVAGSPKLETLEGERRLDAGEVVMCLAGRRGAHRISNDTDEPVRVLIVSTMRAPEINEYPQAGELYMRNYAPGGDPPPDPLDVRVGPSGMVFGEAARP